MLTVYSLPLLVFALEYILLKERKKYVRTMPWNIFLLCFTNRFKGQKLLSFGLLKKTVWTNNENRYKQGWSCQVVRTNRGETRNFKLWV